MKKIVFIFIFVFVATFSYAVNFEGYWNYTISNDEGTIYCCRFFNDGTAIFYNQMNPVEGFCANWELIDNYLLVGQIGYLIHVEKDVVLLNPVEDNYIVRMRKID